MIALINGPFGIGKSTVARLVAERLPGSIVYDPEITGSYLRHVLGPLATEADYQDIPLWRELVGSLASRIWQCYGRDLIVPMCLWRHDYFTEITGKFGQPGASVICFRLTCTPETLRARILGRPNAEGGHAWCLDHLDSGLAAARDPRFGIEVVTEGRDPAGIADQIVSIINGQRGPAPL